MNSTPQQQPSEELLARAARTAHEVNRIFCLALADNSHGRWEDTPESIKNSVIMGARYFYRNPDTTPREQHEAWVTYKREQGWTRGPFKDLTNKKHPDLVSWEELPTHEKLKDSLFQTVIRGVLNLEKPDV